MFRRWKYFEVLHFIWWLICATYNLSTFRKQIDKKRRINHFFTQDNEKTTGLQNESEKDNTLICDIIFRLSVCCFVAFYYFGANATQKDVKTDISDFLNNI